MKSPGQGASSDVAFTPAVKAIQARKGSRRSYAHVEENGGWRSEIDDNLAEFLAHTNSFYLATASADGQPYMQHRGGPKGFIKVLDKNTLALKVWGIPHAQLHQRTLDVHMRRIRVKLGSSAASHLKTIPAIGFQWLSENKLPFLEPSSH